MNITQTNLKNLNLKGMIRRDFVKKALPEKILKDKPSISDMQFEKIMNGFRGSQLKTKELIDSSSKLNFEPIKLQKKSGILDGLALKFNYLKESILGGFKSVADIKAQEPVETGIPWSPWSKAPAAEPKVVWSPWSK